MLNRILFPSSLSTSSAFSSGSSGRRNFTCGSPPMRCPRQLAARPQRGRAASRRAPPAPGEMAGQRGMVGADAQIRGMCVVLMRFESGGRRASQASRLSRREAMSTASVLVQPAGHARSKPRRNAGNERRGACGSRAGAARIRRAATRPPQRQETMPNRRASAATARRRAKAMRARRAAGRTARVHTDSPPTARSGAAHNGRSPHLQHLRAIHRGDHARDQRPAAARSCARTSSRSARQSMRAVRPARLAVAEQQRNQRDGRQAQQRRATRACRQPGRAARPAGTSRAAARCRDQPQGRQRDDAEPRDDAQHGKLRQAMLLDVRRQGAQRAEDALVVGVVGAQRKAVAFGHGQGQFQRIDRVEAQVAAEQRASGSMSAAVMFSRFRLLTTSSASSCSAGVCCPMCSLPSCRLFTAAAVRSVSCGPLQPGSWNVVVDDDGIFSLYRSLLPAPGAAAAGHLPPCTCATSAPARSLLAAADVLAVIGFGTAAPAAHRRPALSARAAAAGRGPAPFEVWRGNGRCARPHGPLRWAGNGDYAFAMLESTRRNAAECRGRSPPTASWVTGSAIRRRRTCCASGIISTRSIRRRRRRRYREFCRGRAEGMRGAFGHGFPAATAIGVRDGRRVLRVYWIAARVRGRRWKIRASSAPGAIRASTDRVRRRSRAPCTRRRFLHSYTFPAPRRSSAMPRIIMATSPRRSTKRWPISPACSPPPDCRRRATSAPAAR